MAKVMTAEQLVAKLKDIVNNYKTIYVYGSIGGIVTNSLIEYKKKQYPSFYTAARTAKIKATVGKGYFGFDCVNVIKSILWGWNGNKNASYGGAKYASNGVPDVSADGMINLCTSVSSSGWSNLKVGEAVWLPGHIGVYIGNGLVIECTPKWDNNVQISGLGNVGKSYNGKSRSWKKHGKIPYVSYSNKTTVTEVAMNKTMYTTTNLNFRKEPNTSAIILETLKKDTEVLVIAKYSDNWYKATCNGKTGYLSAKYLTEKATAEILNEIMYTTANLNFREQPNTSCSVITVLKKDTEVNVISKYSDNWYKVIYDNKTGYLSAKYLTKTKPIVENVEIDVTGYVITKKEIELRKEPNFNSEVIAKYPADTKFTVTKKISLEGNYMYKTKSGFYIPASTNYVTYFSN